MSVLKVRDANGKWVGIPSIKGEAGNFEPHARQHAIDGDDTLTPADIGAADRDHTHTPDEIGAAHQDHSHTPAEIGAAESVHNHDEQYYTKDEMNNRLANISPWAYGTDDLEAGVSSLGTGRLYFVYE